MTKRLVADTWDVGDEVAVTQCKTDVAWDDIGVGLGGGHVGCHVDEIDSG